MRSCFFLLHYWKRVLTVQMFSGTQERNVLPMCNIIHLGKKKHLLMILQFVFLGSPKPGLHITPLPYFEFPIPNLIFKIIFHSVGVPLIYLWNWVNLWIKLNCWNKETGFYSITVISDWDSTESPTFISQL